MAKIDMRIAISTEPLCRKRIARRPIPVWIASVFIVTVMNSPTARTKKKIAAEPYSKPDSHGPTNPFDASTPYSPFGGAFQSVLKRYANDLAKQVPAGAGVAPGTDTA